MEFKPDPKLKIKNPNNHVSRNTNHSPNRQDDKNT